MVKKKKKKKKRKKEKVLIYRAVNRNMFSIKVK